MIRVTKSVAGVLGLVAIVYAVPTESQFSPEECRAIARQYDQERPRCVERDADDIRRDIEDLEEQRHEVRRDRTLRPDQRSHRASLLLNRIKDKRRALRELIRGQVEPLPKNMIYGDSWEARNPGGYTLDGEPRLALFRGAFGKIHPDARIRPVSGAGHFPPTSAELVIPPVYQYTWMHTVHVAKLEKDPASNPHEFNRPVHAPEHTYRHTSEKSVERGTLMVEIRGIATRHTRPNAQSSPTEYWVVQEPFRGEKIFQQPFVVTQYVESDPPRIVIEPFDIDAFRKRAGQ